MFRDGSNIFRIRHGNGNHSTGNYSRKDTEHQKYHVIGSNGTDQVAERKQRDSQFSTQVLRNVSLFLEQEEKMDKLINSEMPAYVHLEGENFRRVLEAMDMAGNLVNGSHPRHARYHAQCIIALLLEDYFFTYDEKDPWNQMPSWLSELLLNMSKIENLQEGYKKMCELAPCSPSHLCRLLKQISGKTPTQYINQERLKYAVYLLAQTDREILDICECCGFSNVSHFYHLFREQFGVSPAKFRKTV